MTPLKLNLALMALQNPSTFALFIILSLLILFLLYYILRRERIISRVILANLHETDPGIPFFLEKLTGFFLFGIVPFILYVIISGLKPAEVGLTMVISRNYLGILVPLLISVSILTYIGSKKKTTRDRYPQLRIMKWSLSNCLVDISGWIVYILGYEFFFRGILWFVCFRSFGLWPALIINMILYAIVHLDQGIVMSVGAIPVGIIFCLLTLLTGSFLFAFLIHSWMAINNDLFSIYHNPDMSFNFPGKGARL